jgi:hypothetical protein
MNPSKARVSELTRRREINHVAYMQKPNSCGLFENSRNDKSDLTGQIHIECPKCYSTSGWWVNGWRKISQNGLAYISLVLKPKGGNATATATANNSEDVEF